MRCYVCAILLAFTLFCSTSANAFAPRKTPHVVTKLGEINGRRLINCEDDEVDGFYGIPYAKAPVGELRFKKPVAHEPWAEPLEATKFGAKCVQGFKSFASIPDHTSGESEDCLLLNVFAPAWGSANAFPVMFWIHGGGFGMGSSVEYGDIGIAESLVTKGVIVVTINYRLGPFGFFTTGDDQCPGNIGLWDQQFALQWVKDNIAAFNGDPNKITVFGESAGGASADLLTLSPHSRDLFEQAITMSGTASAPWAIVDTKSHSIALAAQLNCSTASSQAIMECLHTKTTDEIQEALTATGTWATDLKLLKFTPVIDGDFLPHSIQQLRKEAPKKRVIAGTTEREAGLITMGGPFNSKYHTRPDFGVADLKNLINELVPETHRNYELLRTLAAYEYLRDGDSSNPAFIIEKHMQAFGDFTFDIPLYRDVQSMLENDWNVYLYSFDYANPEAFAPENPVKKAYHFMESPYLFDVILLKPYKFNKEDVKVWRKFTRLFTNFAKSGNPNSKKRDVWKPVTKEKRDQYLSISARPTLQEGYRRSSVAFWTSLMPDIERFEQYHHTSSATKKKSEL
uniref:Carboxylesterase type B domain-containing protein n=1 Tax=Plectus sambesii TaxID=2011161 RepID=A0A914W1F8_9BILA